MSEPIEGWRSTSPTGSAIGGRTKHIRLVADASRSRTGEPQTLYGVVQDVTAAR